MRESRTYGFVRGARGNSRPYRVNHATSFAMLHESVSGPTLPTAAAQQFGGNLRYSGRDANVVGTVRLTRSGSYSLVSCAPILCSFF